MNTAELPKLRELPKVKILPAEKRWRALDATGANGSWHSFTHYDVVIGPTGRVWIAQDDWLPEPGGYDPVAEEWHYVAALISRFAPDDIGEPWYDRAAGVWIWVIAHK